MASETVPAATPGPHDPATTPERGLTSLVAPLAPARPTATAFTLDPSESATTGNAATVHANASSDAYHNPDSTPAAASTGKTGSNSGAAKEGVAKTLLRAVAERWRKGADIHLKRLDMRKARYQAAQIKETRQVTVNRSAGIAAGKQNSASGMGGNSGGGKKDRSSGEGSGKNPGGTGKQTPASRTNSGPAGNGKGNTGGGRGGPSGTGTTKTPKPTKNPPMKDPKTAAGNLPKNAPTNGKGNGGSGSPGSTGGKDTKPGTAGKEGKPGKEGKSGKDAPAKPDAKSGVKPNAKADKAGSRADDAGKAVDLTKKDKGSPAGKDSPAVKPTPAAAKDGKADTAPDAKTAKDPKKTSPNATSVTTPADPKTTFATPGKPLNLRESREAGYRDGTRAARITAHVNAWRDGATDGWADTKQAAEREKTRLDTARDQRKTELHTNKKKEEDVTTATSADHHPTPIGVTQVTDKHVVLDNGQTRTRGEIRSLKQYERDLTGKADDLHKAADSTKGLQAHSEDQAKAITQLLEQTRGVKGGDKLIGALTKLQEKGDLQAKAAGLIHRRAVRAADSANVLLANVDTRYGGIYQQVVDSDETSPAELAFYRDGDTNG